jgi:flavin-dependent dehydrogenase
LNTTDPSDLTAYHSVWTNAIYRELYLGMKMRALYKRLTDTQFDKYIQKLNSKKTLETITMHGDIDYPSKLILPLLKAAPSLLKIFSSALLFPKKYREGRYGGGGT